MSLPIRTLILICTFYRRLSRLCLKGDKTMTIALPKRSMIEIEKKFVVPSEYHQRLENFGFTLINNDTILVDVYYDFADVPKNSVCTEEKSGYPLLTNDYWLRKRNGNWELKYPIDEGITRSSDLQTDLNQSNRSDMDMYHETSNVEEIMSRLEIIPSRDTNKIELDCCERNLDQYVSDGRLWPFAEINTIRKEYKQIAGMSEDMVKLQHNTNYPISIVVDVTDWGYMIGEIELLVVNADEADAAALQIEHIATKLGLSPIQEGSKLIDYLKRHRPCAYNIYKQRTGQ